MIPLIEMGVAGAFILSTQVQRHGIPLNGGDIRQCHRIVSFCRRVGFDSTTNGMDTTRGEVASHRENTFPRTDHLLIHDEPFWKEHMS